MKLQLSLREYRRQFRQPLHTAHGPWRERRGLLLRLQTSSGYSSYGEIAPLPGFGTETLEAAIALLQPCQHQSFSIDELALLLDNAPIHYSATQFGIGLAITQLQGQFPRPVQTPAPRDICALLPSGAAALAAWPQLWNQGHRTFKWKLGIRGIEPELRLLVQLRRSLPAQAKLRLDANGGLTLATAQQCLQTCDDLHQQGQPIEFLEQPLPPTQLNDLIQLNRAYTTDIALDESVTGLSQLKDCYDKGWRGIFVVKGAIAGHPLAMIEFCRSHDLKVVFSSVFETGLARQAVLAMAQAVYQPRQEIQRSKIAGPAVPPKTPESKVLAMADLPYALGFGVSHWLQPDGLDDQHLPIALNLRGTALWQQLSNC